MFGIGRVALIWIAASQVLGGNISAGMLIAFVAYADQFKDRGVGLIDKFIEFRMLKLHAERVADIALSSPEESCDAKWFGSEPKASIELINISFRYAGGEPWILKDCNLRIEAGESVAIAGHSGCGKSTLAKIILGLLEPTQGEVLYGGVNILQLGTDYYRDRIGAVMQDDQLFAGTIIDNISFFSSDISLERIEIAARMAAIHDDIMGMPMGIALHTIQTVR